MLETLIDWTTTGWPQLVAVSVTVIAVYGSLVVLTRLGGLRSFSKMSSFDFAVTVAIGSVLASTIVSANPPILQAISALVVLYAVQLGTATLRTRFESVARATDNEPMLLMSGSRILHDNLRRAMVSEADLRSKLREANVLSLDHVHAVVFEATGDVSVLHGDPESEVDPWLLQGVRPGRREES